MGGDVRCAIYARKSTEEGLEQNFNSLDAQREACSAYILSQRHERWAEIRETYEDGGFSGGNMERPGLKKLLADIEAGRVDVVVVYKVDRLTRNLSDFARIVDVLDKCDTSFVSVTQAFNTTTSMGRLTLNVLLSFAQFEREVTSERIRDKIAASKAKGMWMGGPVPLGYVARERKLEIYEPDAETVRHIFERYLILGSGQKLIDELRADGYRTKLRKQRENIKGGIPFQRGSLFALLANRIYLGEVVHKGTVHPGAHEPIVDRALWNRVQELIQANRAATKNGIRAQRSSLLTGIIRDGHDRRMTSSHTTKGTQRYRYYITHASEIGTGGPPAWRMPAIEIEKAVIFKLEEWLRDRRALREILHTDIAAEDLRAVFEAAEIAADRLSDPSHRKGIFLNLVTRVRIRTDSIHIALNLPGLRLTLGDALKDLDVAPVLLTPATKIRRGNTTKLVLGSKTDESMGADRKLLALLREAKLAREIVFAHPEKTINQIASERHLCRHRFTRLVRLSWLAPEIVSAIVKGRQPVSLTPRRLLDAVLPIDWTRQKAVLGFN